MFDIRKQDYFDVVLIHGKPFLFTNKRVSNGNIPCGFYAYAVVNTKGNTCFEEIRKFAIRHVIGTLIGIDDLPFQHGVYRPEVGSHEYYGNFYEERIPFDRFLDLTADHWNVPKKKKGIAYA